MIEFNQETNQYYIWRDGKYFYLEGATMADKILFAEKSRGLARDLAELMVKLRDLADIWDDRLYGPGGTNEVTSEDVSLAGVTPNQLLEFVYTVNDLKALLDQKPIVNQLRSME